MTTTSVVVVAYRSAPHLARGLPALLVDPAVGDVVVVDNSRDPATAALVAGFGGRFTYVDPGGNLGFARACNLGMRRTGDPVVTFLNPDVLLERPLADLVRRCADGAAAVVAGGLVARPGDAEVGNARHRVTLARELGRSVLGSQVSGVTVPVGETAAVVDQVDGAFLMARRDLLEQLGGFDERFELYFDDVDLCDRARCRGPVVLDTRRYGSHAAGASARTAVGPAYCAFRISRIRYFAKRAGARGSVAALLITVAELLARSATRQPEGHAVRLRALVLAAREALHPGSVRVLDQGGPPEGRPQPAVVATPGEDASCLPR